MRIADRFTQPASAAPVFSFEFFPPRTPEAVERLYETATELKALHPAFISVTYGAGGSARHPPVDLVTRLKHEIGPETMAPPPSVGATKGEAPRAPDTLRPWRLGDRRAPPAAPAR